MITESHINRIEESTARYEQVREILEQKGYSVFISCFEKKHIAELFYQNNLIRNDFTEYIKIYKTSADTATRTILVFDNIPKGFYQCRWLGLAHKLKRGLTIEETASKIHESSKSFCDWVLTLPSAINHREETI